MGTTPGDGDLPTVSTAFGVMDTTPAATPVSIVSASPLWRLQLIRVLQIAGILAGFLGAAEMLDLWNILPQGKLAQWLLVSGPTFSAVAKRVIELIGDYLDDGIKNDSFKLQMVLLPFLFLATLALPSCSVAYNPTDGSWAVATTAKDVIRMSDAVRSQIEANNKVSGDK